MREKLIALSLVKGGDWGEVHRFLRHDRKLDGIDELLACKLVEQMGCAAITLFDAIYPEAWKQMPKPPFVVFYQGDLGLLQGEIVSIIGGKVAGSNTKASISHVMKQVPDNVSVMSGFETGAEVFSMSHAPRRIAVIAAGFEADSLYQRYDAFKAMGSNDLILSELPPGANFDLPAYYRSYHLMHELSNTVCVFELPRFDLRLKYLAYLTEVGKEVVVAPDVLKQSTAGGLGLVNLGAKLLLRAKDVFERRL